MRRALLLVLLIACKRDNDATPPAPSAAVSVSAPVSAVSAPAAPVMTNEKEVERVVRAWSDALDKHDVAALEDVYAENVVFYTMGSKSKKTVLAIKKAALGPSSQFHQQIMDTIVVKKAGDARYEATFTKRSGNGTKLGETQALIVVGGTPLRIMEERDAPHAAEDCETVASEVAWNSEPAKKAMEGVRKNLAKFPDRGEGGMGPQKFEDGTIQASIGVHHPDRFERIASYTVYPNGRLDLDVMGQAYTTDPSGETMDSVPAKKLPEADRKRVTAACGPPAESHGH